MSERKLQEQKAQACCLSVSGVFELGLLKKRPGDIKSFSTLHKKRPLNEVNTDIDDFDKWTIRRIIHDCHPQKGWEIPTLKVILRILKYRNNYNGCVSSLTHIIRQMRFRWKRAEVNRKPWHYKLKGWLYKENTYLVDQS